MIDTIRKLVETYGPSGHEEQIRTAILEEIAGLTTEEPVIDAMGNLIAWQVSPDENASTIMLSSHMDEIGLMVTHVDQQGFLRFTQVGVLYNNTLHGNRVIFADGTIGVIGVDADVSRATAPALNRLFVDVGNENGKSPIKVGDAAGLYREMIVQGNRVIAKSLDDRIACAIQIEIMRRLKDADLPNHVAYVFSVQEEVGLRGAQTAAYAINPDYGIALDVTLTGDTAKGRKMEVALGDGPAIKIKDAKMLASPEVIAMMEKAAKKAKIPYQREVLTGGSTDAAAIQLAQAGVKAGCLSIPCRYVHTTSETVDIRDVENSVKLMVALLTTKT